MVSCLYGNCIHYCDSTSFPIDWLLAIPIFLLISLYRRKLFFKKLNIHFKDRPTTTNLKGIREFFKLASHNSLSQSHDGYRRVKYFCMKCGNEHNKILCPKCGSKMKRLD